MVTTTAAGLLSLFFSSLAVATAAAVQTHSLTTAAVDAATTTAAADAATMTADADANHFYHSGKRKFAIKLST